MSHSQPENTNKRRYSIRWILLAILLLSLMAGGVAAYLSVSFSASNTVTVAYQPTVTVTHAYNYITITIDPQGYGVFARLAVDASWQKDGKILPVEPEDAYTVVPNWRYIDGYYYFKGIVTNNTSFMPVDYTDRTMDGYNLVVNVSAQVIQAVGVTDDGTMSAVEAAWGITPEQILGE